MKAYNHNLGEKGVQAVDFLSFFNKSIELCYTLQGKLVHQVDNIRLM